MSLPCLSRAAALVAAASLACAPAERRSTSPEQDLAFHGVVAEEHHGHAASASLGSPARRSELQRAVDGTPAGDTLVVYGGHYRGALRLDRPIALIGRGAPLLDGEWAGDVVTVSATGVTLQGFRIRRSGLDLGRNHAAVKVVADGARIRRNRISYALHGVVLEGAGGAIIEGNEIVGYDSLASADRGNGIHLWDSRENLILDNVVRGSRDGLYFTGSPANRIAANRIEGTRIGLHYMYSDSNVFTGNVFRRNEAGAAIMLSRALEVRDNRFVENVGHRAYGLLLQTADDSRVVGNAIEGNTVGLFLDNSNRNVVRENRIVGNFVAVHLYASAEANRITENAFVGNEHDLVNDGGRDENAWSFGGRGNYWAAHPAYDLDGDGVADAPHRIGDAFGALARQAPSAALFTRSPALDALALTERLFPAFAGAAPVDEHPLMRPGFERGVASAGSRSGARRVAPFLAALTAGLIVLTWGRRLVARRRP